MQTCKGDTDVTPKPGQKHGNIGKGQQGQTLSLTAHPPDRYRGMGMGTGVVLLGAGMTYNTTINPSESTERLLNAVDSELQRVD